MGHFYLCLAFHRMEPAGAERHGREARSVSSLARTNQTPYNLPMPEPKPVVAIIMGSKSDWETMRHAVETLDDLGVPNEARVLSAHRTPDATAELREKQPIAGSESSSPARAAQRI